MEYINTFVETLFKPNIFQSYFIALGVLSLIAIFLYFILLERNAKFLENDRAKAREFWEKEIDNQKNIALEYSQRIDALKAQLEAQARELAGIDKVKEGIREKEELMQREAKVKEKLSAELKDAVSQITKMHTELKNKEEVLKSEVQVREKLKQELQEAKSKDTSTNTLDLQNELLAAQNKLKSQTEVYEGLKEQYADLERQVDALNQKLALEKTLHERLKKDFEGLKQGK